MTRSPSPTIPRRELAILLRRHREALEMTVDQAARAAEVDKAQVSRLETASRLPVVNTVKALCSAYSLDRLSTDRLLHLAREGRRPGWWEDYKIEPETATFVSFESASTSIDSFEISVMPGLFQTREYATETVKPVRTNFTELRLRQTVESRLARQQILTGANAIQTRAVIDEAALRRRVGSSEVMRKQIIHLLKLSQESNVTIRVLPFRLGANPGQDGPFMILDFAEEWMGSLVYVESQLGQVLQDKETVVNRCRGIFDVLLRQAASDQESREFMRSAIAAFEG